MLFGLFGLTLLLLLAADASAYGPAAKKATAAALVMGGALAGGLFYFHYVPGLLRAAREVAGGGDDPFPGRTVFIFHNESKESVRLWAGGYGLLLVAGLVAAPAALRRARAEARPVLVAWLVAPAGSVGPLATAQCLLLRIAGKLFIAAVQPDHFDRRTG